MKYSFVFQAFLPEIEMLAAKVPLTASLKDLVKAADFDQTFRRNVTRPVLRSALSEKVLAATDPWAEIMYQSLYIKGDDPNDRVVLQEPPAKDPMVGVMVLKAARLQDESGMVYCGTEPQLKGFASKLGEYEKRGNELDDKDLLECLIEAAEAEGLKVIFHRVCELHGGEAEDDDL